MTTMGCQEAEELLGAYALEALSEDETRRLEDHLRGCAEHRAAAAELRRTSALLPLTVEARDPSPELRARIIAAVQATPHQPLESAAPLPKMGGTSVLRTRRSSWWSTWGTQSRRLAVAAVVALALGIGGVVGYQVGQSTQAQVAYNFQGDPTAAPGAEARLVYFKDRQQAVVVVSGLPHLDSGQVYEMWLIKNGVPVDKGVSASQTGEVAAQVSADLSQFQQFAITIEPGEQALPTTKPILVGNLQNGSA